MTYLYFGSLRNPQPIKKKGQRVFYRPSDKYVKLYEKAFAENTKNWHSPEVEFVLVNEVPDDEGTPYGHICDVYFYAKTNNKLAADFDVSKNYRMEVARFQLVCDFSNCGMIRLHQVSSSSYRDFFEKKLLREFLVLFALEMCNEMGYSNIGYSVPRMFKSKGVVDMLLKHGFVFAENLSFQNTRSGSIIDQYFFSTKPVSAGQ